MNDGLEVKRPVRQLPNQAVHRIERPSHLIRCSEYFCKETLKSIESLLDPQHDLAPRVILDITSFSNVPFPPPPNRCSNRVESVQRMIFRNNHVDRHGFHVQYSSASMEKIPAAAETRTNPRRPSSRSNHQVMVPKTPTDVMRRAHVVSSDIARTPVYWSVVCCCASHWWP